MNSSSRQKHFKQNIMSYKYIYKINVNKNVKPNFYQWRIFDFQDKGNTYFAAPLSPPSLKKN